MKQREVLREDMFSGIISLKQFQEADRVLEKKLEDWDEKDDGDKK